MPLIFEGLVTTLNADGSVNLAPMGPLVEEPATVPWERFVLRPFAESTTCKNLLRQRAGVFHITDEVLLFAQAVTGNLPELSPHLLPATVVQGMQLRQACHACEFRIVSVDSTQQRVSMQAEVVATRQAGHWRGFNRAQFAVIEACILATRLHLLPLAEIQLQWSRLVPLVEKTAGLQERAAFELLQKFIDRKTGGLKGLLSGSGLCSDPSSGSSLAQSGSTQPGSTQSCCVSSTESCSSGDLP